MTVEQLIKMAIFFVLTFFLPFGIGCFALGIGKKKIEISKAYIYGFVIIWAVMQMQAIPFIYLKVPFSVYAGSSSCIFAAMYKHNYVNQM